jgi:hypothetical protein
VQKNLIKPHIEHQEIWHKNGRKLAVEVSANGGRLPPILRIKVDRPPPANSVGKTPNSRTREIAVVVVATGNAKSGYS